MNEQELECKMLEGVAQGCMKPVAYLVVLLVAVIICHAGCKSVQQMEVVRTDTLRVVKTDTVREREVKIERRDSVVHDSVVEVRTLEGKVAYKEVWRDRFVRVENTDSVDKYRSLADSLRRVANNSEQKTIVKTKTDYKGWWAFGGLLLIALGAFVIIHFFKRE